MHYTMDFLGDLIEASIYIYSYFISEEIILTQIMHHIVATF